MKSPTKCLFPAALLLALSVPSLTFAQHYTQTDLVSNVPISGLTSCATPPVEPCVLIDPNLQNPWGLVHGPTTPWWISNNAGGTAILYNTSGLNPPNPAVQTPTPVLVPVTIVALNAPGGQPGNGVVIPNAPSQPPHGSPTAVMFNGSTTDFLLVAPVAGVAGKQASFIWVTEDGTVQGWNPGVLPTTAIIKVDNSQVPSKRDGAVYKGATIVEVNGMKYILAANFRQRRIDVFDTYFNSVNISEEAFDDDRIPRDYAPFNVQAYGPNIYVTYAKQDAARHDDTPGLGFGFVDVFSREGRLLARLEHGDWFNAPWGVVLAPADFGEFSHALLVGNFGSGTIAAFNPETGHFLGNVLNPDGSTLTIDGLWGLGFGNGGSSGPGSTLFFTAGPNGETNGLFGTLTPIATELSEDDEK